MGLWTPTTSVRTLAAAAIFLCAFSPGKSRGKEAAAEAAADPIVAQVQRRSKDILGGLVEDGRSSFAAIVLTMDGRVQLSSSYGSEKPNIPFSMDDTLVDLNSISKVLTAVAIAQLIGKGTIRSLDDPVNLYLKHFKLPLAFGHEVTIRELATHSAGMDLSAFPPGPLVAEPVKFFEERFPRYFFNPGKFSSYDNFGPRLLSYMVSEITAQPLSRHIEKSILRPLGMNHTFLTAAPEAVEHRVMSFQINAPEDTVMGPPLLSEDAATLGGIAVSTMSDMAKLAAALAGPGDKQGVITQSMRDLMFAILQSNGDGGSARGLLFDAVRTSTTPFFTHGGRAPGIDCMLVIDAVRRAGAFFCYGDVHKRIFNDNAFSPPAYEEVSGQVIAPFSDRPDSPTRSVPFAGAVGWNQSWNSYLGLYLAIARHRYGFSRLRTVLNSSDRRLERSGQTLSLSGHGGFVEIRPGMFASPYHLETFSLARNPANGNMILSTSDLPSAFERVSGWEDPTVVNYLLAILVLISASGSIYLLLPVYGVDMRSRLAVAAYGWIVGCGIGALFGLRAFGASYFEGITWPLHLMRVCAFLTIPACVWLITTAIRIDKARLAGSAWWGRLHLNIICASSILLVVTLLSLELISFTKIT